MIEIVYDNYKDLLALGLLNEMIELLRMLKTEIMKIKQYKLIFLLIGLMFFQSCNSQTKNGTDWEADLDYIYKELSQKHCNFFTVKSEKEFAEGIEKLKGKKLTGIDCALSLQQVAASFGDSHTRVNWGQFIDKKQMLPLYVYWFKDGIYILKTNEENKKILGNKLLSINQIPIQSIIDSISTLITVDNQALVKKAIPGIIPCVQVLRYFGIAKGDSVELELEDLTGKTLNYFLQTSAMNKSNRVVVISDSIPLCVQNRGLWFSDYYSDKDDVYYLQYNNCWSRELEIEFKGTKNAAEMLSFQEFEERIFTSLQKKPIGKIVFDLRYNGGGDSEQGTVFIKKLAEYSKQNSDLKLYVVLGRKTFSSAIINAMDFKKMTNAVFIGEETGGKPNHFGEVKRFKLPNSEVQVNYSTKYFKRAKEDLNTITPDVLIESSFIDYKNGIDPVYEWIRDQK